MWFPSIDKARSKKILSCNRRQWGKLVQFMTGHNFLNRHNYVVKLAEQRSPICNICDFGYIQDTAHIIGECPYFLGLRKDLFLEHIIVPPFVDLPIGRILAYLS